MSQKNIFTAIAAVLILQGLAFFFMGGKVASDSFPTLDQAGLNAVAVMFQVIGLLSIIVALISYAVRGDSSVLWAYLVGFGLFLLNTLKHKFIDGLNVPIPAIVIQVGIVIAVGYLFMQNRNNAVS